MLRSAAPRALVASLLLATTGLAVVAAPRPAAAQTQAQRDEAKARYLKGIDLFEEGDYQAALIEFKRSYELVPNFNVLYNIGQVHFQLQDYASALKVLTQYLEEGDKRIPASRRTEVEKDVDKLKSRVATVTIKVSQPGADILVDDVKVGTSPLSGPVTVSAGKRKFDATKEGFRATPKVEEIAGQEQKEIVLELVAGTTVIQQPSEGGGPPVVIVPGQPQPQPPPPEDGPPIGPIVMWSVTGALAIGTGVMGGLALAADGDLSTLKQTPGTSPDAIDSKASDATTFALVSDVFLGVTIASAGVATWLTIDALLEDDAPAAAPTAEGTPTARPVLGPGYVGVVGAF